MLFDPTDLFEFGEDIFCISFLLTGLRKKNFYFYLLGNQKNVYTSNRYLLLLQNNC